MVTRSLLMALTLCAHLNATAIALIVTPRFIVVAADSKVVGEHVAAKGNECKIRKAGDTFYVPNKFVNHSAAGYDLNKTVLSIAANSVAERAAKVKAAIGEPLKRAVEQSRREDTAAFKDNFASRQVMGVVFVGFENGAPVAVALSFIIEDLDAADLKVNVEQHSCPGADCPEGYALVFVPQELKAKFEQEHPRYWIGDPPTVAANAEAFINQAIAERLPDVGPPVSVLVIDSARGRWLKRGLCTP